MNNQWNKERFVLGQSFPELREIEYKNEKFYIFDEYRWSVPFQLNKENIFNKEEVLKVFNFAFKSKDNHRNHRSGGDLKRDSIQIFFNIFLGKLGEIATYKCLLKNNIELLKDIDYDIKEIGNWDDCDIITKNNKKISVKSSKYYSKMILLEKKDYNDKGQLQYNIGTNKTYDFDFFSYVRIAPMMNNQINQDGYGKDFKNNTDNKIYLENSLKKFILNRDWYYEEPFILSKALFLNISINNKDKYFVKKGNKIKFDNEPNKGVLLKLSKNNNIEEKEKYIEEMFFSKHGFKLDANNYYFPLKYMKKIENIKNELYK